MNSRHVPTCCARRSTTKDSRRCATLRSSFWAWASTKTSRAKVGTGSFCLVVSFSSESILLPEGQRRLIRLILEQTRCDVVLVYFSGCGALDLSAYEANDRVVGILSAGYTGMFGGTAVAEILVGKVNPSTFPPRA